MVPTSLSPRGLNRDQGLVKAVAMVTMLIDHLGVVFFPRIIELRVFGRIAFPLFCFGIVTGFMHTRDWRRYALRLAVAGVVAQPFYMLALNHTIRELNVLATLLLGLLSIVGMREKRYGSHIWAPALCLVAAAVQPMDYGWRGVALIQLMYLARHTASGFAAMFTVFCMYWGTSSSEISQLFGVPIRPVLPPPWHAAVSMVFSIVRLQALAILSLPFMVMNTRSGIKVPKYISYAMYPGHLALLWLLKVALNGAG